MRTRTLPALLLLALLPAIAWSQTTPIEGLRENAPAVHAFTDARIVIAPGRVLERGTLVIRDGLVEAVGANVSPPADARVWAMGGRTIYPGFIDAYSHIGMRSELPETDEDDDERGAFYWNPQMRAFVDATSELPTGDGEERSALRSQGFTVAHVVPRIGLFRGQTAAVSLGDGRVSERVVRPGVAQALILRRDTSLGFGYPTSSMGAIAFIRQALHDADWHARAGTAYDRSPQGVQRPERNAALAALGAAARGDQPLLVEARTEEEVLRVLQLRDEFPVSLWVRGSGAEYRLIEEMRALGAPLILPLAYPDTPNVQRPADALNVSLGDLRHWYLAPENPARLAAAGIEFALTADGIGRRQSFLDNLRTAIDRGLDPETALSALTTVPARYLGISGTHGTLERGRVANLVIADGDLFRNEGAIQDVWVDGRRFEVDAADAVDPRGRWAIVSTGEAPVEGELVLEGRPGRLTGAFIGGGGEVQLSSARIAGATREMHVAFPGETLGVEGAIRLSGSVAGNEISGWGELPDGRRIHWRGTRAGVVEAAPDAGAAANGATPRERRAAATLQLPELRPSMDFGRQGLPDQPEHVLVRGATVWTMGPAGVLENADLLVRRGRVVEVGQNLRAPAGAAVIEGAGKHVTPGLIDAHLHSGLSGGVNETGSTIVPEVRVGDVLTIDNIWMYRQLAGGLTTAHVMHGSANPIGGQNQHVKLRWGGTPEQLKFEGAPRTVKFALGENPKRRSDRYPDTRMGTEQIIRDHFRAAREYEQRWAEWERGRRRGVPPRRDLRMEALVDILNQDISIQAHSYRADEILMLMRLVEEFDIPIKAFHHGVEAYKVAPELARHGAGAVVWSDWSSFKIEAYDATLFNARLLHDAGVLTSLHSDNSQIAARMNWEAAKLLRAGMDEVDALSLVTINTARVLGVEDRVGSLEPGKDADFVVWSGHPLSTATRAEQTWIDGRRYFDLNEDRELRARTQRERSQIIQHILNGGRGAGSTSQPTQGDES